ncbi:hypothetical protein [Phytohabitans houttuyneae]|uniref:Uncharacterized protein n=1 Tax=Phytohabitans houttuyneae TaxID=1076126 RepID=A0A6V8KDV3_9ACTN|nr:hypothetical protein [Phytohabitans houttuyneae]GFJ83412.1 hypothetical protein Phou_075920 [Phytohabitans houttuyneae]
MAAQVGRLVAATLLGVRRYRVHIRAVGHGPARPAPVGEHRHDAVPADAGGDVEAGRAEPPRDDARGAALLARGLRMRVDVPAQRDERALQPGRDGVHRLLVDGMDPRGGRPAAFAAQAGASPAPATPAAAPPSTARRLTVRS